MIFTLQSDGVKHKPRASTIIINGQVGSEDNGAEFGVGGLEVL
jgi:hypothetical protein